jgi:DNA-directed RNA polymerase specialized sigma24 family protein
VATWDEREGDRRNGIGPAPAPYRSLASFTAALQVGESAALQAVFVFYAPLLRDQARRFGVDPAERAELVTTVLDDFVLHVLESGHPPHDVSRYLVAAVRNRIRNHRRDRMQRHAHAARAATTLHGTEQRVVAESHSEYSLRAVAAPDMEVDDRAPLESAILKLARWSAAELRADELALMVGVSHHVPLRDVAAQLGISYVAARVRLHRLRDRFRKLVLQHVATLEAEERREVERFLCRAGIDLESRASAGGRNDTV